MAGAGLSREELEQLYQRYAPTVFRRARTLLGRDADAWDAVQEVFAKMVTEHERFRGESQPMTWLYRITTNLALNMLRSRKIREPMLTVIDSDADATLGVDAVEARNLLRVWLTTLEPREQEIATLLYIDGLSQEEVADVLGLSRKTINREVAELRAKATALGAVPREEP